MYKLILTTTVLFFISCGTTKEVVYEAPPVLFEEEILDTLVVSAPAYNPQKEQLYTLPQYNPEATRTYDIIHTKLKLGFDWEKQHVLGVAYLDIEPLFYPIEKVTLDAKQFIIHSVKMGENGNELSYDYNDFQLEIDLGRMYKKGEKTTLFIDYTAQPNEGPMGGSAAITSDKGLFFINPTNESPDKPRQIWTQGETENNSKWFPTFDKPNERCTQEIYLTVEEEFETLSNGELISTTRNGDGTKTDYWKMDKPHAPYLFMLMIGDFARVKEDWNGKELEYMVYPEFESSAKNIFNHTPEMLTFFSEILDYPYPWNKYSQVIAEDYVSGAMENTTGVIFGEFVQKTNRELIDNENDQIVAHEMFHHWFGDLVTCESWANLTLNEGFANYSEYLWYEHKYGKDAADAIRISEMEGYFYMALEGGTHPLIHYGYDDKEEMFDAHSYNKGGLVLHMLRNIVGDEAFFASLSKYLKDNEFTAVETAELRMAFEETTGMDLNWFFDQWYLDKGHPQINVSYEYADGQVLIYTEQKQEEESHRPIFVLPLEAAIYGQDGSITYHDVVVDARVDTLVIDGISEKPLVTVLDGKSVLLGEISEDRTEEEWINLLKYSPNHFDKREALSQLKNSSALQDLAGQMINDKHHIIRNAGLDNLNESMIEKMKAMVTTDPHSSTRAKALNSYSKIVGEASIALAEQVLENEQAYAPIKAAIKVLNKHDKVKAIRYAEQLKDDSASTLIGFLTGLFAESGDPKHLGYIENNLSKVGMYQVFNVFGKYSELLLQQDADVMMSKIDNLKSMAIDDGNMFRRYLSTNTINSIKRKLTEIQSDDKLAEKDSKIGGYIETLKSTINEIVSKEKDQSLIARYGSYMD
ncbi:MAG: M1 family aminopeptidase [Saprospiraceae bacterium]|nr:M1 family aminopeptidase [Saprospiraceae bacterium]